MTGPFSWTVYRVPIDLHHCDFERFDWSRVTPNTLREIIEQFVADTAAGKRPHLILSGSAGLGKSHLSVAVYRTVVATVGTTLGTWVHVPGFCDQVKQSYRDGSDPWESEVTDACTLVVLDDLFGRQLSEHDRMVVARLIDTAYSNGAAVLVTMNQDVETLVREFPAHETSRLLANGKVVVVKGADQRLQRGRAS